MVHINRRSFLQMGGLGLAGLLTGRDLAVSEDGVRPVGTAHACIFIKLIGGPSHVDTFDLKVGPWTPRDFDVTDCGHLWLSRKLFPALCRLSSHLSVVRSVRAWGLEHNQAHYALMAGRKFNPGFVSEIPHIGSVVALEAALDGQTGPFPPFMAFNGGGGELESGFLPSRYGPFATFTATPNISHPEGLARFRRRWDFLQKLDRRPGTGVAREHDAFTAYRDVYLQAKDLTHFEPFEEAFMVTEGERQRYGASLLGDACIVARKTLAAHRGTRFIVINHSGDTGATWDTHANIYADRQLPLLCHELDRALGALVTDLQGIPATTSEGEQNTLFDKTLIIAMGEFGRTPPSQYGPSGLNNTGGRDHWPVNSALFLGGGVKGGRVLGATDAAGANIVDSGWDKGRPVTIEDIAATIYSSLGINWTKEIRATPSGRVFRYTPYAHDPVHALF